MRKYGCLKCESEFEARRLLSLAPLFRGERSTRIVRRAAGEGPGTAEPDQKLSGRKVCDPTSTTRKSVDCIHRIALPLTRSLRCASASTSPREKSGERLRKGALR